MYSGCSSVSKSKGNKIISAKFASNRVPYLLMSLLVLTAAICATTQVLASKLNRTHFAPLSLSLDDALEYLSRSPNK